MHDEGIGSVAGLAATIEPRVVEIVGSESVWTTLGVVATVATAVATGVSTFIAFWWRHHDRPEADWAFLSRRVQTIGVGKVPMESPVFTAKAVNVGDGLAFQVKADGKLCKAVLRARAGTPAQQTLELVPLFSPGDELDIVVSAKRENWGKACVVLEWTASPTRKRKRLKAEYQLKELITLPALPGTEGAETKHDEQLTSAPPAPDA